ncbi:ATP-binding cassette domain-containing protein [Pseudoroseicyclus sp. CXY001]|uniref:ATP-binding cassette domain-containing protein n=1 Tax=Pseudoroseicyclus sp. CXY001 TaxID=3242492 RepID=UPI003570A676
MIETETLGVALGGRTILDGLNLRFGQGGITALVGPNGAGKSTLLHALAGLLRPARGRVTVEGLDMARAAPIDRAKAVALLTQSERVTARLTVADLVGFGRWPHHKGRPGAEDHRQVAEAMELFDLTALSGQLLDSLSGGQRQRAFTAMAYAQETPWMLLDEPLSALDPRYSRDLMERLQGLTRPGPGARSVIIVLHDLSAAARYADRVVALKGGRLVTSGPASLKLTGEMLSGLFGTGLAVETVRGRRLVAPV